MFLSFALLGCLVAGIWAAPNVTLDQATVTGVENGTLEKFLGIPYALPPYDRAKYLQWTTAYLE